MATLDDLVRVGPTEQEDLGELGAWPLASALDGVDLSLSDGARSRVSALPWRGQFSPETVERVLTALAPAEGIVLDPFVGSGTTLLEAARRGYPAVGFDINPAAIALARCICLASFPQWERDTRFRRALSDGQNVLAAPNSIVGEVSEAHAFALVAHVEGSADRAKARFESLAELLPTEPVAIRAEVGDARATGLTAHSVDFVLTSPPYINVFNYHQYGRPLSDAFGWPILTAARSEIGSNRKNRGNRFRTVVQYSIDMALAVREMNRVLALGGRATLVVGRESRVRRVPVYNGELLARLVRRLASFERCERAERSFVSRFGERIFEDILVLSGNQGASGTTDEVETLGREVGAEVLRECASRLHTRVEVESAIAECDAIVPSPGADSTVG